MSWSEGGREKSCNYVRQGSNPAEDKGSCRKRGHLPVEGGGRDGRGKICREG